MTNSQSDRGMEIEVNPEIIRLINRMNESNQADIDIQQENLEEANQAMPSSPFVDMKSYFASQKILTLIKSIFNLEQNLAGF